MLQRNHVAHELLMSKWVQVSETRPSGVAMNTHIKSIWRAFVFVVVPLFVAPLAYAADDLAAPVILVATERLLGLPYE